MGHRIVLTLVLLAGWIAGLSSAAHAAPPAIPAFDFNKPIFVHEHPFAKVRLVEQVSENNPGGWTLALNNAQNLLDYFGQDDIQIVIVTFGPGERMLFQESPVAQYIASLDTEGVEFDACANTYKNLTKQLGYAPKLVKQAVMVPAGVVRIMQLEQHGFDYLRP